MQNLHYKRNIFYPVLVFLVGALGIILFWNSIQKAKDQELRSKAELATEQVAIRLEESTNNHLAVVRYLRREWAAGAINDPVKFTQRALSLIEQFQGFQAINYIDPAGFIRWVVPEESNLPAKNRDVHFHPNAAQTFLRAERSDHDFATPPISLWQGGQGFTTFFPLDIDSIRYGYLNGVFRIDHFLEYSLGKGVWDNFYFAIIDGDQEIYSYLDDDPSMGRKIQGRFDINVLDRVWTIELIPKPFLTESKLTFIQRAIFLITGMLSLLLSGMVRILMVRRTELHQNLLLLEESREKLRKRSSRQDKLLEIARRLSSSLELELVLKQIGLTARELLEAYNCIICMVDEQTNILKPVIAIDPKFEKEILGTVIDIDRSFSGLAYKAKTSMIFNNVLKDNRGFLIPGTGERANERLIVSPFIINDKVIGVVCLSRIGEPFDEDDRSIAETFAAYASTAISNAQTHDNLKREISERIDLENQLRQAQKMEAVGQLAGGVAHDFNNKLGGIMGYAELALSDIENTGQVANYLKFIIDRCVKSANLVQQLLAFSRQQILKFQSVNLNRVITDSTKLLRRVIGENIDLQEKLDPQLKTVNADLTAIDQIILNLCINARDAMPEGGILSIETANVTLDQEFCRNRNGLVPGEYIRLKIADNGVGIDEIIQQRIFEPFFTTKSVNEGTGLGLSMVFGLIKQHGGRIECNSQLGQGTTFTMYFHPGESEISAVDTAGSGEVRGGSETILLVEDDASLLHIIESTLIEYGYTVITAENGQAGLNIYRDRQSEIDLVITDVVMPSLGGMELYKEIHPANPDLKFLFITGYGPQSMLVKQSRETGFETLQKPFKRTDLARKIRELLGGIGQPDPV
ncbi:MAG: ATP-binding protein [Candidatus Neomarinimicrobiota bacterium]